MGRRRRRGEEKARGGVDGEGGGVRVEVADGVEGKATKGGVDGWDGLTWDGVNGRAVDVVEEGRREGDGGEEWKISGEVIGGGGNGSWIWDGGGRRGLAWTRGACHGRSGGGGGCGGGSCGSRGGGGSGVCGDEVAGGAGA